MKQLFKAGRKILLKCVIVVFLIGASPKGKVKNVTCLYVARSTINNPAASEK